MNLIANQPNAVVSTQDVTFDELGFNSSNISIVYELGNSLKSWKPGRVINSLTGIVENVGYYIIPKIDMDLPGYFAPPLPKGIYINIGDYMVIDGTDRVTEIQEIINTLPAGATLFFPRGTYIVANDSSRLLFDSKSNIRITGEPGTIFQNLAGNGGTTGENILFQNVNNVDIEHIVFRDEVLTRWATYNNHIGFLDCTGVHIHDCTFEDSSNKHIHIGGNCSNITIERNKFSKSCYNSNPLAASSSSFSSIFIAMDNVSTQRISNVHISDNYFYDNYLYCISANNSRILDGGGFELVFSDIHVYNNTFKDSTGLFVGRGRGITFENNYIEKVGVSYILNAYDYDPGTARYYSKTRSENSGQAANASNTVLPLLGGLLNFNQGYVSSIKGNIFVDCLAMQRLPSPQAMPAIIYVGGQDNRSLQVMGNQFQDTDVPLAGSIPQHIRVLGATNNTDVIVANNYILLPEGYTSTSLIRVQNGSGNYASNNRVKILSSGVPSAYGGTVYQDITETGGPETDPVFTAFQPRMLFGDNATGAIAFAGDLNTITKSGIYYATGPATNKPNGQNAHFTHLQISSVGANYSLQMGINILGQGFTYRQQINGTWGSWVRLVETNRTTQAIDFASVPANSEGTAVALTVSGVKAGYVCHVIPGTNIPGLIIKATCDTDGIIQAKPMNITASAIDPGIQNMSIVYLKDSFS